jgi:hypothetical protein
MNPGGFDGSTTIYPVYVENHVYLSHNVQVVGVTWWTATNIVAGVGDLMQMTRDGQA